VGRVFDQRAQRVHRLPVVDVGDQTRGRVLPALLAQDPGRDLAVTAMTWSSAWKASSNSRLANVKVEVYTAKA
jgi:hypothetical protein